VPRLRYVCWGALSVACAGSAADAQSQRKLDLSVTGAVVYDSNFPRASRELAELRGIKREEVRFSPAVGLNVALPFGRQLLYGETLLGYDFHAVNSRFNRERLSGRLGLASRFGRCQTSLEAEFSRGQTQLEDIDIGPLVNVQTTKALLFDGRCPREVGFVPSLTLDARSLDNNQPLRASAESRTRSAEAGLSYVQPSLGEVGLFARVSRSEFPNRFVSAGGGNLVPDEFEVRSFGARFSRNVGTLLRGSVRAAVSDINRETGPDPRRGVTYRADLTLRPLARLNGRLSAEKKVEPSTRIGINYSIDEVYRAEMIYALAPRVTLTAGAGRRDREFAPVEGVQLELIRKEQTASLFGSARVQVNARMFILLDAQHEKRKTDLPLFDYSGTRIGLSTRIAF
jgi:hypothetical protein